MFTYILSDKRKPTVFKAENLTPGEVISLAAEALTELSLSELYFYTFIIIDEETNDTLQLNGGEYLEKVFG